MTSVSASLRTTLPVRRSPLASTTSSATTAAASTTQRTANADRVATVLLFIGHRSSAKSRAASTSMQPPVYGTRIASIVPANPCRISEVTEEKHLKEGLRE